MLHTRHGAHAQSTGASRRGARRPPATPGTGELQPGSGRASPSPPKWAVPRRRGLGPRKRTPRPGIPGPRTPAADGGPRGPVLPGLGACPGVGATVGLVEVAGLGSADSGNGRLFSRDPASHGSRGEGTSVPPGSLGPSAPQTAGHGWPAPGPGPTSVQALRPLPALPWGRAAVLREPRGPRGLSRFRGVCRARQMVSRRFACSAPWGLYPLPEPSADGPGPAPARPPSQERAVLLPAPDASAFQGHKGRRVTRSDETRAGLQGGQPGFRTRAEDRLPATAADAAPLPGTREGQALAGVHKDRREHARPSPQAEGSSASRRAGDTTAGSVCVHGRAAASATVGDVARGVQAPRRAEA